VTEIGPRSSLEQPPPENPRKSSPDNILAICLSQHQTCCLKSFLNDLQPTPVNFEVQNFPRLGFFPREMPLDFTLDRRARHERSAGLRTETTEAV
jgi:hypothetical protein